MCGIIGIAGTRDVAPLIVDALKRLEYRGYDSAGVATLNEGRIDRRRSPGKLNQLVGLLEEKPLPGFTGIGHTRWATHGAATERNAHPHASSRVALVHNGIIENFRELKEELRSAGHQFESETDTEVAVHLITQYLDEGFSPEAAAKKAVKRLAGAFALVMIFKGEERLLIAARRGSPLAVGYGQTEAYLGSDAFSLAPVHQPRRLSGRWRYGGGARGRRRDLRCRRQMGGAADPCHPALGRDGRQGQSAPFHGQGNPRTARSGRPHHLALCRCVGADGEPCARRRRRCSGMRRG